MYRNISTCTLCCNVITLRLVLLYMYRSQPDMLRSLPKTLVVEGTAPCYVLVINKLEANLVVCLIPLQDIISPELLSVIKGIVH